MWILHVVVAMAGMGALADLQAESCIFASPSPPLVFTELTYSLAQEGCNQLADCQMATPWILFPNQPTLESTIQCDHERVSVCSTNVPVAFTLPHLYESYIDRPLTTAGFPLGEIWTNRNEQGLYQACTYANTNAYPMLWNASLVECGRAKTWLCVCTVSQTLLSTSSPSHMPTWPPTTRSPSSFPTLAMDTTTSPTPALSFLLSEQDAAAFAQLSLELNRSTWNECYHDVADPCLACDTEPSDPFGIVCDVDTVRLRRLQDPTRRITELRFPNLGIHGILPLATLEQFTAIQVLDFSSNASLPDENHLTLPSGVTCVSVSRCQVPGVSCRFDPYPLCSLTLPQEESTSGGTVVKIEAIIGGLAALLFLVLGAFMYAKRSRRPQPTILAAWPASAGTGTGRHPLVESWRERLNSFLPATWKEKEPEEPEHQTESVSHTTPQSILKKTRGPASSSTLTTHGGGEEYNVRFEEHVKRRTGEWELIRKGTTGIDENTIVLHPGELL